MPATMPPAAPLMHDNEGEPRDAQLAGRRRAIWMGGVLVTAVVGGALVWLNAGSDSASQSKNDVPLVKAAELPVKVRPEDPGGMQVAHRDKLIYQRFEGDEAPPAVERLLSAPEEPLPPPRSEPEASPDLGPESAMSGTPDMVNEGPPREFMAVPPEEAGLAQPIEEFFNNSAPGASVAVETPPDSSPVAMAPARPRPNAPPPPITASTSSESASGAKSGSTAGLSAEARVAQSLLMGSAADEYAIQLGSVRSRQEANVEWERLRQSHADILGGLRPMVLEADLGQRGMYYRLRAGPITSQNSARQLCNSLVDRKVACIVVPN
jgi:hypothetical protein